MAMKTKNLIVAACKENLGIGYKNKLPWKLRNEMQYFKDVTMKTSRKNMKNAVIMGRKTWDSIPEKFRPLKGRVNIVLSSSDMEVPSDVYVVKGMLAASELVEGRDEIESAFVIGGSTVYQQARDACDRIYMTEIDDSDFEMDTYLPKDFLDGFKKVHTSEDQREGDVTYRYIIYENQRDVPEPDPIDKEETIVHEEMQYLDCIQRILNDGVVRQDRTGTGTISCFGAQMKFSLRDDVFPLLTTKRVFWRGVAEELLWFISGDTNAKTLQDKNVHIWDGNGSREYLDSIGLTQRETGDLGPVYGFQWRHFGAEYTNMHADYTNKGVDQLANVIDLIKNNPTSRRIVLSAWNPADLKHMALPPCHMFCQFYVANGQLSCQMYQRSADMGLGVPFNIASYALLTRLIAQVTDLQPGDFIHVIGDAHVYTNHIEPLTQQITRTPRAFPFLKINPEKKSIDDFTMDDFEIINYAPHKAIKMAMSV